MQRHVFDSRLNSTTESTEVTLMEILSVTSALSVFKYIRAFPDLQEY